MASHTLDPTTSERGSAVPGIKFEPQLYSRTHEQLESQRAVSAGLDETNELRETIEQEQHEHFEETTQAIDDIPTLVSPYKTQKPQQWEDQDQDEFNILQMRFERWKVLELIVQDHEDNPHQEGGSSVRFDPDYNLETPEYPSLSERASIMGARDSPRTSDLAREMLERHGPVDMSTARFSSWTPSTGSRGESGESSQERYRSTATAIETLTSPQRIPDGNDMSGDDEETAEQPGPSDVVAYRAKRISQPLYKPCLDIHRLPSSHEGGASEPTQLAEASDITSESQQLLSSFPRAASRPKSYQHVPPVNDEETLALPGPSGNQYISDSEPPPPQLPELDQLDSSESEQAIRPSVIPRKRSGPANKSNSARKRGRGRPKLRRTVPDIELLLAIPPTVDTEPILRSVHELPDSVAHQLLQAFKALLASNHPKLCSITDPNNSANHVNTNVCLGHQLVSKSSGSLKFFEDGEDFSCQTCSEPKRPCARLEQNDEDRLCAVCYPQPKHVIPDGCTWKDIDYWL